MGDVKALSNREAIEKMSHIAKGEVAMLCTVSPGGALQTRPMSTSGVDPDGTLWFMSRRSSIKNKQIEANGNVRLIYAVPSRSEYMDIEGTATITRDRAKIDELWSPFAKTWFSEGKDDPELSLIRVSPAKGYYWDTKNGKMVQLVKIAVGAITGREFDDGVEGKLAV